MMWLLQTSIHKIGVIQYGGNLDLENSNVQLNVLSINMNI